MNKWDSQNLFTSVLLLGIKSYMCLCSNQSKLCQNTWWYLVVTVNWFAVYYLSYYFESHFMCSKFFSEVSAICIFNRCQMFIHTHTRICIYIYMYTRVCVYLKIMKNKNKFQYSFLPLLISFSSFGSFHFLQIRYSLLASYCNSWL